VAYPNGRIPMTELHPVPAFGGQTAYLLPGAAASFLRVQRDCWGRFKWFPVVTSAGDGFRSYERQVAVFQARYAPRYATVVVGGRRVVDRRIWNGTAYYRHTGAAAAVPGTSNHGKGITVDISGLGWFGTERYRQIAGLLEAEGWSNAEGRTVSEPWHWNYTRDAETVSDTNAPPDVVIVPVPSPDLPDPLDPEDDDMYTDEDRARDVKAAEDAWAAREHAALAERHANDARAAAQFARDLLIDHALATREHAAKAEAHSYWLRQQHGKGGPEV
jgi:hypothetical protein